MTTLSISSHLAYDVAEPTSFAFAVVAARTRFQVVSSEHIGVTGGVDWQLVPYGEGSHQLLRLTAPPGALEVSYSATVAVDGHLGIPADLDEVPFGAVPPEILPYLNPSRYCESDKLVDFAARHFGATPPGHDRVRAVSDWVRGSLMYQSGATDGSSSTTDVLLQRAGVCRDFAHVAIALCRALGIPARYVAGYGAGVEPQDFHGFFEAYVGSHWYLFDPTGMARADALVRIADGRDAADTPFATLVGRAELADKTVAVELVDAPATEPAATSTASG